MSRADVCRYLYPEPIRDQSEAQAMVLRKMDAARIVEENDSLFLAVVLEEVGQVIGDVMLRYLSQTHRQGEIGYVLNPMYAGRGLATEAARVMLRIGFEELGLHRIIARCDARNLRSVGVMVRLGMSREANFIENEFVKGEWTDELVYSIREVDWRDRG